MSIDIAPVRSHVKATVAVELSGAPDLTADTSKWPIQPFLLHAEYTYAQTEGEDGWTGHEWRLTFVRVSGHRILKAAADGSRRLGKDTGVRRWYTRRDLADLPDWVAKLVEELRPSGQVDLTGDVS